MFLDAVFSMAFYLLWYTPHETKFWYPFFPEAKDKQFVIYSIIVDNLPSEDQNWFLRRILFMV